MINYSVCIATYKRPELLKKLIESLLLQKNINLSEVEFIVVDNDKDETARDTINDYIDKVTCKIHYYMQPEKNISLTRNVALERVKGNYVFFIDDDEYADENWMSNHINNLNKFNADAAFGQVISYFPQNIPNWIQKCMVYQRNTNPSGAEPANMNTGNCIIKRIFFIDKGFRFDKEYGITGGSDYQLFSKIVNEGYKFVSCYEAITYEYVSETRANVKWLIKRVARTGNNFSRTQIEHSQGIQKLIVSTREFTKGLIQALIALLVSVLLIWNPTKSLNWFLTAVSNIMKPLAAMGIYYKEYKGS